MSASERMPNGFFIGLIIFMGRIKKPCMSKAVFYFFGDLGRFLDFLGV